MAIYVCNHEAIIKNAPAKWIDRRTVLGNPFAIDANFSRERSIAAYRRWLWRKIKTRDAAVCRKLKELKKLAMAGDLNLLCHCKPKPCHGDVIKAALEWAIRQEVKRKLIVKAKGKKCGQ